MAGEQGEQENQSKKKKKALFWNNFFPERRQVELTLGERRWHEFLRHYFNIFSMFFIFHIVSRDWGNGCGLWLWCLSVGDGCGL